MALTIDDLRRLVRKNARNAMSDAMYSGQDIDDAYFAAADEWTGLVKPNRTLTTLALSLGSSTIPAFPANWTPENTMQVDLLLTGYVINPGISFVSMEQLRRKQWEHGSPIPTARPTMMAVADATAAAITGIIDTLADAAYTINLWRWTPFAAWTSGGVPSSGLGFTDEQVRIIAMSGAPYYLQRNEPENSARCDEMYRQFLLRAQQIASRNAGGRSGQVEYKDNTDCEWRQSNPQSFYPQG
jgi:hypothetical protein